MNTVVDVKLICRVWLSERILKSRSVRATKSLLIEYINEKRFVGGYNGLNDEMVDGYTTEARKALNGLFRAVDRVNAYKLLFENEFCGFV